MRLGRTYRDHQFVGKAALVGKKPSGGDFTDVMQKIDQMGGKVKWLRLHEVCMNMGYTSTG